MQRYLDEGKDIVPVSPTVHHDVGGQEFKSSLFYSELARRTTNSSKKYTNGGSGDLLRGGTCCVHCHLGAIWKPFGGNLEAKSRLAVPFLGWYGSERVALSLAQPLSTTRNAHVRSDTGKELLQLPADFPADAETSFTCFWAS